MERRLMQEEKAKFYAEFKKKPLRIPCKTSRTSISEVSRPINTFKTCG